MERRIDKKCTYREKGPIKFTEVLNNIVEQLPGK